MFEGQDIAPHRGAELLAVRRRMQMVYQDPYGSLNPRMTIRNIVAEPLAVHGLDRDKAATRDKVAALIASVGLLPDMADRYPHEFSGGQRQRIGIARALALEPSLLIADEPVSALDVSIQAQVINLFMDLQERLGLTYLFIAHDLAVVRHISTRIAVMYLGRIVEIADRDDLYSSPLHPLHRGADGGGAGRRPRSRSPPARTVIIGEVPSALRPPPGCSFHTRCPRAMAVCKTDQPLLRSMGGERAVACHLHAG